VAREMAKLPPETTALDAGQTPLDATASDNTSPRRSAQRRQRRFKKSRSPVSPGDGCLAWRRRPRESTPTARIQVPPRSTPTHHPGERAFRAGERRAEVQASAHSASRARLTRKRLLRTVGHNTDCR
jgi:hypothetical protein